MNVDNNELLGESGSSAHPGRHVVSFPKGKAKRLVLFESKSDLTVDEWMDQIMVAMKEIYNHPALQKEIAKRQS
jgi:hypothetical protein